MANFKRNKKMRKRSTKHVNKKTVVSSKSIITKERKLAPITNNHSQNGFSDTNIANDIKIIDVRSLMNIKEDKNQEREINRNNMKVPTTFSKWKSNFPWLAINSANKLICTICKEATTEYKELRESKLYATTIKAFVDDGFKTWRNATVAFNNHQTTKLHSVSSEKIINKLETKSIIENRTAMFKIFTTIKFLAKQGLPITNIDSEENSNLVQLLKLRFEDIPELSEFLNREGFYSWTSQQVVDEILHMMANDVIMQQLKPVHSAVYYSVILEEVADIFRMEQISIRLRIVREDLNVIELFIGLYETQSTRAEDLFTVLRNIFIKCNLNVENLIGLSYDGTFYDNGTVKDLQGQLKELNHHALFVHYPSNSLELIVHDAIQQMSSTKHFISIMEDLINLILLKNFVLEDEDNLSPYCPMRKYMQLETLKSVKDNFEKFAAILDKTQNDEGIDCTVSAKASTFLQYMQTFEFYFLLTVTTYVFEQIKLLNSELQRLNLCINESRKIVETTLKFLSESRKTNFESIWKTATQGAQNLSLEEPDLNELPLKKRKIEFNSKEETPKEYYRKMYLDIFEHVSTALQNRFQENTLDLLSEYETFAINKKRNLDKIMKLSTKKDESRTFYNFDVKKLVAQRDYFIDIVQERTCTVRTLNEIVDFITRNPSLIKLIPEYIKFIRFLLTIPESICTFQESFSALRRVKQYLRNTTRHSRIKNSAVLYTYPDVLDGLDINKLLDRFILRNQLRRNMFAVLN